MKSQARVICAIFGASLIAACGAEPDAAEAKPIEQSTAPSASTGTRAGATSDEPITALCIYYGDQMATCECATKTLRSDDPDADIYSEIAAGFLETSESDKSRADRWEEAEESVLEKYGRAADQRELNNRLGRAHRDAIKSCGG